MVGSRPSFCNSFRETFRTLFAAYDLAPPEVRLKNE
jgi:hypothetical protein